ncbi:MAG: transcription antitermination factor NusB [Oscillospiraceae bacterium]|nr:transcription antitermination factor NusB [Oscillospiraceae bacterium]
MTRSTARHLAIQLCFASAASGRSPATLAEEFFSDEHFATLSAEDELYAELPKGKYLDYILRLCSLVVDRQEELDAMIERHARGWRPERISRTALAVLRCAICEILYFDDVPAAAAINEAVELDKRYDDSETVSFVNGVLGGFVRETENDKLQEEQT